MVQSNVPRKDAYMPDTKKREERLDLDKDKETETAKDKAKESETAKDKVKEAKAAKDKTKEAEATKDKVKEAEVAKDKTKETESAKDKAKEAKASKDKVKEAEAAKDKAKESETIKDKAKETESTEDEAEAAKDEEKEAKTAKDNEKASKSRRKTAETERNRRNSTSQAGKRKASAGKGSTSSGKKDASAGKGSTSPGKKDVSAGKESASTGKKSFSSARRKKRKRRAVRRKQTPFEKYFMKISGPIAFLLLIVSTILTGRTVSASRKAADEATAAQQMQEAAALALETAETSATPSPAPTMRPRALPIPENVPEQDVVGFFTNGLASVDGQSVTVLCGGDNLIHKPIYQRAQTDNGYDFDYLYQNVKSFIESADIATINQEAPLATDLEDPSGYPHFNTPKEVGQDLFDAGFDVINIGNNHMYDIGSQGALVTEQFFQNRGIPVVGFYRSDEDFHNIRIIEKNGIKIAFLSFVEMTNLDPDDPDLGYCVSMEDRSLVKEQIEEAREQADVVVAHAHWGEEGTTELTDGQVEMAHLMVDWGVDIIFGNHPHVIQSLVTITREEDSQLCPVIYSMGNFVSAQTHRNQIVSAMLAVKITRDANGIARPSAMGVMPVITHFTQDDRMDIVLYPLATYSEELAEAHYVNGSDGDFSLDYIYGLLNESIPDRYLNRMSSLTSS